MTHHTITVPQSQQQPPQQPQQMYYGQNEAFQQQQQQVYSNQVTPVQVVQPAPPQQLL